MHVGDWPERRVNSGLGCTKLPKLVSRHAQAQQLPGIAGPLDQRAFVRSPRSLEATGRIQLAGLRKAHQLGRQQHGGCEHQLMQ